MMRPLVLRPYQEEALAAQPEQGRPILALATGLGKTVVFSALIGQRLERGGALVLVHTDELCMQATEKLRLMLPGTPLGLVKADANDVGAPVIVASRQTLARPSRLRQMPDGLATLVIDEGHHACETNSYGAIMRHVGAFDGNGLLTLGATATPFRADGQALDAVYEGISYQRDVLWGITNGYLCDVQGVRVALAADLSAVHTRGGDFIDAELAAALAAADAPQEVVQGYLEHAAGRKALGYFPSVHLAEQAAEAFCAAGIPAAAVSGSTPRPQRQAALADLRAGRLRVVTNCLVLTEGYDEPSADCILMARPTKSPLLYCQIIGRGLRPFFGKVDCLVLDFVGATGRHKLVGLEAMLGLPLRGRSALQCLREQEEKDRAQQRRQEEQARISALVGHRIDLLERQPTQWAQAGDLYATSIKDGQIAVESTEGGYLPFLITERGKSVEALSKTPLPLEYAHAVAEDWILAHRPDERFLSAPDARWRARPPTERAIAFGAKWGLVPRPDETGGAFSDRVTITMARSKLSQYHRRARAS